MKYIDQWLSGLGLEYILPTLKLHGITTPKRLAQLSLRDIYEVGKSAEVVKIVRFQIYKNPEIFM